MRRLCFFFKELNYGSSFFIVYVSRRDPSLGLPPPPTHKKTKQPKLTLTQKQRKQKMSVPGALPSIIKLNIFGIRIRRRERNELQTNASTLEVHSLHRTKISGELPLAREVGEAGVRWMLRRKQHKKFPDGDGCQVIIVEKSHGDALINHSLRQSEKRLGLIGLPRRKSQGNPSVAGK